MLLAKFADACSCTVCDMKSHICNLRFEFRVFNIFSGGYGNVMHSSEQSPQYNYCALPLAVYACRPDQSRGRLYPEPESAVRTPFQRDRDRIIHAAAFRHLKHKTQVFVSHEGDHFRTRLTHTLEVAQIARTLSRALLVNEDLAEAVALAHDLGHPPFAHMGEDVLKTCMAPFGGFEHNDQSLRIVTMLEERYPDWNGLNLSFETLEGIVKHNGPITSRPLPTTLAAFTGQMDLGLDGYASVEAQVAALADDIAYNNHDVEDGLQAGLFTLDEISQVALLREVMFGIRKTRPDLTGPRFVHALIRDMIGLMVMDVLNESRARLKAVNPSGPDDVRKAYAPVVAFSAAMHPKIQELRAFLMKHMYRHTSVRHMGIKASRVVKDLFDQCMSDPLCMPDMWQARLSPDAENGSNMAARARVVVDYIAGMTDRSAILEHARMFGLYEGLK